MREFTVDGNEFLKFAETRPGSKVDLNCPHGCALTEFLVENDFDKEAFCIYHDGVRSRGYREPTFIVSVPKDILNWIEDECYNDDEDGHAYRAWSEVAEGLRSLGYRSE